VNELVIEGGRPLRGRIRVPGDKAISHRALILAALADGDSTLTGLATGGDVLSTRSVLDALGVEQSPNDDGLVIAGGGADGLHTPGAALDCGNSGTTLRMLAGLLAGRPFTSTLTGDDSLRSRPMARIVKPLRAMGARVDGPDDGVCAPLTITGGGLAGARIQLEVASGQVKTAVLLAGLQASGTTTVIEPMQSRDDTERMLRALGVGVPEVDGGVAVQSGAPIPFALDVPGDISSAAFWAVAAAAIPGSEVTLEELALNPTRTGVLDVLMRMGADVEIQPRDERLGIPVGDVIVRSGELRGTRIEGDEIPRLIDELPVLAVAAAIAHGPTEVHDAAELRVKESDRIGAIHEELGLLGATITPRADGFVVDGDAVLRGTILKGHGDHRIAMTAAIAALVAHGESRVRGWEVASVSYPGFELDLARLQA
jgi:3-phosphoshikimate 1-carboxyvinyltransferase